MQNRGKRLSAGVVIVRRGRAGHHFLLLRPFSNWDFPKGLVEDGEVPLEAARREVEEETGIIDLSFDWGLGYTETGPYSRGKTARYYMARTATTRVVMGISPELGRPEHSEYRWVAAAGACDIVGARVNSVLSWALARINNV